MQENSKGTYLVYSIPAKAYEFDLQYAMQIAAVMVVRSS